VRRTIGILKRGTGGLVLVALAAVLLPSPARADVGRIREKALELEQKLNRNRYDVEIRGEKPNRARIYKDFDFILDASKVDEVAAAKTDPQAGRLRLYLIQSIVESELAPFTDELRTFEQTNTADLGGKKLHYGDLLQRLAKTPDDGERRKLANLMDPLIETAAVFRLDILRRQNEQYQKWGFANYADFYAQREGLDLDALDAQAAEFLTTSQALYDSLFTTAAAKYLGTEPRKVKFYDLPYLTGGAMYSDAFPAANASRRLRGLFKGLGVDLGAESNLDLDEEARPGRTVGPVCVPVLVPNEIRTGLVPIGAFRDTRYRAYLTGEAQIYSLSTQTAFEPAYLVNQAAQSALAWIPRLVLDEQGWIRDNSQNLALEEFLTYRAFTGLFEVRFLAAMTRFEIAAYRGSQDPDKDFRNLARDATGVRIAASEAHRSLEFLTQLRGASRFQGLLAASALRHHLRETMGPEWYKNGQAGALLTGFWEQGGALTVDAILSACGGSVATPESHFQTIEAMLADAAR